jgi:molecular chaperone GrpE
MSDEKTREAPSAAAGEESAASPWQGSEEAGCEEAMEQLRGSSAEVERLEAEKADLTDRLLRLAADMDNLRRRHERELADARKYAVQKFAADMLVVGDNLKRALDAVPAERRASDDAFAALVEGVEMTRREMDRLLEKNGIARIAAEGERFDPNRHQAMFEVPDASVPAGTVVQVVQDGFSIGDRVLRAAMVGVSTGGPKAGETGGSAEPSREAAEAGAG